MYNNKEVLKKNVKGKKIINFLFTKIKKIQKNILKKIL